MEMMNKKWNAWFLVSAMFLMMSLFQSKAMALDESAELLQKIPVSGVLTDGKTFTGRATVTEFSLNDAGQLVASGILRGKVGTKNVRQEFSEVVTQLSKTTPGALTAQAAPVCDILFLDLGPLSLDVLGLTVDLSPVQLDINAVAGAGNLLGNLLCAVVSLLDGFNLDAILLGIINNILTAINTILEA